MEYKRSTFQLGLQARNVNNQRKIIAKDRTAFFISNRFNVNNKEKTKGRRYEIREVKKREEKVEEQIEEKRRKEKSRKKKRRKKKKIEEKREKKK